MGELTLRQLQEENKVWADHNFPDSKPYRPLLGAVEEIGELAHAQLKSEQGIRGTQAEHHAAKIDAVADIIIYLADYCNQAGIDMQSAVQKTWVRVRERDWKKDPQAGGESK